MNKILYYLMVPFIVIIGLIDFFTKKEQDY